MLPSTSMFGESRTAKHFKWNHHVTLEQGGGLWKVPCIELNYNSTFNTRSSLNCAHVGTTCQEIKQEKPSSTSACTFSILLVNRTQVMWLLAVFSSDRISETSCKGNTICSYRVKSGVLSQFSFFVSWTVSIPTLALGDWTSGNHNNPI